MKKSKNARDKVKENYPYKNLFLTFVILLVAFLLIRSMGESNNSLTGLATADFRDALRPIGSLSDSLVNLYESNLVAVEFVIYLLIFLGISVFIFGEKFGQRGTAAVSIGISLALSFSLVRFKPGLTTQLGPVAMLILIAIIVGGGFAALKRFNVETKKALAVSLLIAVLLIAMFVPSIIDSLEQSSLGALIWALVTVSAIFSIFAIIKWLVIDPFEEGGLFRRSNDKREPGFFRKLYRRTGDRLLDKWFPENRKGEEIPPEGRKGEEIPPEGRKTIQDTIKETSDIEQLEERDLGTLTIIMNKINNLMANVKEEEITNAQKKEIDIIISMVKDEMALTQSEIQRLSKLLNLTSNKNLVSEIDAALANNYKVYELLKKYVYEFLTMTKYPKPKGGRLNNLQRAENMVRQIFDIKKTALNYSKQLRLELSRI